MYDTNLYKDKVVLFNYYLLVIHMDLSDRYNTTKITAII